MFWHLYNAFTERQSPKAIIKAQTTQYTVHTTEQYKFEAIWDKGMHWTTNIYKWLSHFFLYITIVFTEAVLAKRYLSMASIGFMTVIESYTCEEKEAVKQKEEVNTQLTEFIAATLAWDKHTDVICNYINDNK